MGEVFAFDSLRVSKPALQTAARPPPSSPRKSFLLEPHARPNGRSVCAPWQLSIHTASFLCNSRSAGRQSDSSGKLSNPKLGAKSLAKISRPRPLCYWGASAAGFQAAVVCSRVEHHGLATCRPRSSGSGLTASGDFLTGEGCTFPPKKVEIGDGMPPHPQGAGAPADLCRGRGGAKAARPRLALNYPEANRHS
jgi:hypothetical protein